MHELTDNQLADIGRYLHNQSRHRSDRADTVDKMLQSVRSGDPNPLVGELLRLRELERGMLASCEARIDALHTGTYKDPFTGPDAEVFAENNAQTHQGNIIMIDAWLMSIGTAATS